MTLKDYIDKYGEVDLGLEENYVDPYEDLLHISDSDSN
jgi:hypothetical protein